MTERALVVGAGNIGLATGRLWAFLGGEVAYWDTNAAVRRSLASAGHEVMDRLLLDRAEIVFVCVPTPTIDGALFSGHVEAALSEIAEAASGSSHDLAVVLRSTVLPGMNRALMRSARFLGQTNRSCVYWPSFAREACAFEDELAPHAVVLGREPGSIAGDVLTPYLARLPEPARWVSFEEAELIKYGANLFNAAKISFFNALGGWSARAGGAPGLVASLVAAASEASWNPDYGFRTIGEPFAGQCLPKDLDAFITWLDEAGAPHADLLRAARAVNEALSRARAMA